MTTAERIEFCKKLAANEGTEIGDAIKHLAYAASILNGISNDYETHISLLMAENLCRQHIEWLRSGAPDYEFYNEMPDDVFSHFSGGAKKLTEEEWEEGFNPAG
jgi:hypothetical protein